MPSTGDTVTIAHDMTIDADVTVGDGSIGIDWSGSGAGFHINSWRDIHIRSGARLTVDGDIYGASENIITMDAGTEILFSNAGASQIILMGRGYVDANGTSGNMCTIDSSGTQWSNYIGNNGNFYAGDSRFEADFTIFRNAFVKYNPHNRPTNEPYRFTDCTFDACHQVDLTTANGGDKTVATGRVEFVRCKFQNTVLGTLNGSWGILTVQYRPGVEFVVQECDFDAPVLLTEPPGLLMEDCVLRRKHFRQVTTSEIFGGNVTYRRNIILFYDTLDGPGFRFGDTIEDTVIWCTDNTQRNPHYCATGGGTGVISYHRMVWGSDFDDVTVQEGDIILPSEASSGTQATNRIEVTDSLVLPNAHGFGAANSASGCLYTMGTENSLISCHATNNTLYLGSTGGYHVGETIGANAGAVGYVRSNLFVGANNSSRVLKMWDVQGSNETDTVIAEDVSHNGGHYLQQGDAQAANPSCGKGYDDFAYSGSSVIGLNDVDEQDPQFVDSSRNPLTWDVSLGGPGTWASVCDRLSPIGASSMTDLQTYLRDGWAPQNTAYQGTGYGGSDIGAIPVVAAQATKRGRMLL